MPLESRRIAAFLLRNPDAITWKKVLIEDNILQKKTPKTALRQANLIKKRLMTLDAVAWEMIANREQEVALQLLLVAAMKQSQLLTDFFQSVYLEHLRRLDVAIVVNDWEVFMAECAHKDASVKQWSALTQRKLFEVIRRILVEAKYLENTRTMKLTPQVLHPNVQRYLAQQGDDAFLNLLEFR